MFNTKKNSIKHFHLFIATILIVFLSAPTYADEWHFDSNKSTASFSLSVWGKPAITGSFTQFDGVARLNATTHSNNTTTKTLSANTSDQLYITVPMSSLKVDLPKQYAFLEKVDLFRTKKYPFMSFSSRRVHYLDNRKAKISGELEFMGKRRNAVFNAKLLPTKSPQQMGFRAVTRLKRSDYGVVLPLPGLSDSIAIEVKGILVSAR